jgi:hypothetical protein
MLLWIMVDSRWFFSVLGSMSARLFCRHADHESRILQGTIFGTLHAHLTALDFSAFLPDVMIIADEVDSPLTQTMDAFTKARPIISWR